MPEQAIDHRASTERVAKKWIQKAIKHPGRVHEYLGIPEDEEIPMGKLDAAIEKVKGTGDKSLLSALQLAKRLKGGIGKKGGSEFRSSLVRLAYKNADFREKLIPLLRLFWGRELKRTYEEYTKDKERRGEKPLPREKWESRQKGKKEDGKAKGQPGGGLKHRDIKKVLDRKVFDALAGGSPSKSDVAKALKDLAKAKKERETWSATVPSPALSATVKALGKAIDAIKKEFGSGEETSKEGSLRDSIVRVAYENPDFRSKLLPLLEASTKNWEALFLAEGKQQGGVSSVSRPKSFGGFADNKRKTFEFYVTIGEARLFVKFQVSGYREPNAHLKIEGHEGKPPKTWDNRDAQDLTDKQWQEAFSYWKAKLRTRSLQATHKT